MLSRSFAVIVLLMLLATVSPVKASDEPDRRPNILLAIADDWGYPHAGCYGDPVVRTPTFDRLAREGVLFTQALVSSPSCTPSRGALLSGQHFWRLREGANLWSTLPADIPVYPDLLEDAGYHVGFTRKGWGPGKLGDRARNPAGPQFANFNEFLQKRPRGKPFCFWFGSVDPHRPYEPGSGRKGGLDPGAIKLPAALPDAPEVRDDVADYYFEVERFDREVGELLARLEADGELHNTMVMMTGDHGLPFPRGKGNLYDLGARVPLAVRWGGKTAAPGRREEGLVSLTDLAPTFLRAAGVDVPDVMTGSDLLSILTAPERSAEVPRRDHVLLGRERHTQAQEAPDGGGYPSRAIRTKEYLYIRNFAPERWPAGTPHYQRAFLPLAWLGDCDNGLSKVYLWQRRDDPKVKPKYDLAFAKRPAKELYDLAADPDQLVNVAGEARYAAAKQKLGKQLLVELRLFGDPRAMGEGLAFDEFPYYGGVPQWPGEKP